MTEPHWRQAVVAAGMNFLEVYVAWLECLYQAIEDPVGVFRKPEIAAILARFATVFKKLIMVTLMQQAMTFVAAFMWGLNKLGIYRKKKARERRFQDTDVIRDNIRSVAMSDAAFAVRARLRPRPDPRTTRPAAGASVESRRMFTKGTVTGTAATVGVHGVDDPAPRDAALSAASANQTPRRASSSAFPRRSSRSCVTWRRSTPSTEAFDDGSRAPAGATPRRPSTTRA